MNSIYDKECLLIEINSRLLGFDMDDIWRCDFYVNDIYPNMYNSINLKIDFGRKKFLSSFFLTRQVVSNYKSFAYSKILFN